MEIQRLKSTLDDN